MRTLAAVILLTGAVLLGAQAPPTPPNQTPGTPAPGAASTPPPAGRGAPAQAVTTAVIRGRVVAADTGLPLRRAQVYLAFPAVAPPSYPFVATDEQGRFEFPQVAAGRYTVTATKAGYLSLSYGQRQAADEGRTVDVRDGQTIERIDFSLPRGSFIAVRVTDDVGEPIARVHVQAERPSYFPQWGRRMLVTAGSTSTDDRGEARLAVPPGDYYISANPGFGRTNPALAASDSSRRYGEPTYFPGALRANEAQPVRVVVGQDALAAFSLVPARAIRLTGAVRTSEGSVPQRVTLNVQQQLGGSFIGNTVAIQPDGSFEIPTMMPGDYLLQVRPQTTPGVANVAANVAAAVGEYARMPLTVASDDIPGLVLTTTRATLVRGHMVFDGQPASTFRPGALVLTINGALGSGRDSWNDDWTFEIPVAGAGTLRLGSLVSRGWFLKSVTLNGKDVTDVPTDFSGAREYGDLEIVMTEKRTEVAGTVTDDRNAPVTTYAVVVFPEERTKWSDGTRLIAVGRADQEGRFSILGLPPGRYLAAPVSAIREGEERDPQLLARLLENAQRVMLAEAESKTLVLKLGADR